jgi:hypothetical protein
MIADLTDTGGDELSIWVVAQPPLHLTTLPGAKSAGLWLSAVILARKVRRISRAAGEPHTVGLSNTTIFGIYTPSSREEMKNENRRLGKVKDTEFAFQTSWSNDGEQG